jgi:hypothetical protein
MHSIYNYIPETNPVSRVESVAAVLQLQFTVHVMLFPMYNVFYFNIDTYQLLLLLLPFPYHLPSQNEAVNVTLDVAFCFLYFTCYSLRYISVFVLAVQFLCLFWLCNFCVCADCAISVFVLAVQLVFVLFDQHVTKPELNQERL